MLRYFLFAGAIVCALFAGVSCSQGEPETPEQFVARIADIVQRGDEKALFDAYLKEEKDIQRLLTLSGLEGGVEERAREMSAAAYQDKDRVLRRFTMQVGEWGTPRLDSVWHKSMEQEGMPMPEGIEVVQIKAYFSDADRRWRVTFPCVSLDGTPWKMVNHPDITTGE